MSKQNRPREISHEQPTAEERAAIADGRRAYRRGDYVALDDWRHAVGLLNLTKDIKSRSPIDLGT